MTQTRRAIRLGSFQQFRKSVGGASRGGLFRALPVAGLKEERREGLRGGAINRGREGFSRQGTDRPRDGTRHLSGGSSRDASDPGGPPAQGARASCLYHGACTSAPKLRRTSSASPSSVPILARNGALTFRCQKH